MKNAGKVNETCDSCGGDGFSLVDGFYYCDFCGGQSHSLRRELEADNEIIGDGQSTLRIRNFTNKNDKAKGIAETDCNVLGKRPDKICVAPSFGNDTMAAREQHLHDLDELNIDGVGAKVDEDYDRMFGQAGHRLATFTRLLKQMCHVACASFDVSDALFEYALEMWMCYLRWNKVAFCQEEIMSVDCPESERPFQCAIQKKDAEKRNASKVQQKNQRPNKKKKEDIIAAIEKEICTQEMQSESLLQSSDIVFTDTHLRTSAVQAAGEFYLGVDLLEAIIYLSCVSAGSTWILLSDITRWFREGRFPLSPYQQVGMKSISSSSEVSDSTSNYKRTRGQHHIYHSVYPLSEHMRMVVVLSQVTAIPKAPICLDFGRIIARFVYNLNLPDQLLHSCHYLMQLCPPRTTLDVNYWTETYPVCVQSDLFRTSNQISACFKGDHCERTCSSSFYPEHVRQLFTIEAKAAAVLLMALKLHFGLDDCREHILSQKARFINDRGMAATDGKALFDFSEWMLQTRLRMACWNGTHIKHVLDWRYVERFKGAAYMMWAADGVWRRNRANTAGVDERNMDTFESPTFGCRRLYFEQCRPNRPVADDRYTNFYNSFADDFPQFAAKGLVDPDALIAPLRYQATGNLKVLDGTALDENIDQRNRQLFFRNFQQDSIEFKSFGIDINDQRYKRPLSTRFMARDIKSDSEKVKVRKLTVKNKACEQLLHEASWEFSHSFDWILRTLALTIGDDASTVYFLFVLLENALFNEKAKETGGTTQLMESAKNTRDYTSDVSDEDDRKRKTDQRTFQSFEFNRLLPLAYRKLW